MNDIFKSSKARLIFGASVLGVALTSVVLRTLALFLAYDSDIGYFSNGAVLPIILYALLAVSALLLIPLCFIKKVSVEPLGFGESRIADYLYALPAAASLYGAFSMGALVLSYADINVPAPRTLIFCLIFSIPAIAFFVLSVIRAKKSGSFFAVFAFLTMAWLLIVLASTYFDVTVPINSPNKTFSAFALASIILFLSSEARLVLTEKNPRVRMFSTACSVIFVSVSAIPNFIAHFFGAFANSYAVGIDDIICLSLLFPITARFISMCFAKEADSVQDAEAPDESGILD